MQYAIVMLLVCVQVCIATAQEAVIVNVHVPVTEVRRCRNWMRIDEGYTSRHEVFKSGDSVVIIQMKGARADSNGTVLAMGGAGRFERNVIERRSNDTLFFTMTLLANYEAWGAVQIVNIEHFPRSSDVANYDSSKTYYITTAPFDGRAGGVMVLFDTDTVNLWCDVSANGIGYRMNEGICSQGPSPNTGWANMTASSGGGHGGSGGMAQSNQSLPPKPGTALSYVSGVNWIFMGGGPGAVSGSPPTSGGGIIILDAPAVNGNNFSITANGAAGTTLNQGAGAGGAVLITSKVINNVKSLTVVGGNAINGGAGGGGVIRIGTITALNLAASSYSGGTALYGREGNGEGGRLFYNVSINEGSNTYKAPTLTVTGDTTVCPGDSVTIVGYGGSVVAWTNNGDTVCALCDSVRVSPDVTTSYYAHIQTNGCTDTLATVVVVRTAPMLELGDTVITCPRVSVSLDAPKGFSRYAWSTGDTTMAIVAHSEGTYVATVWDEYGCVAQDSILVLYRDSLRMQIEGIPESGLLTLPTVLPITTSVAQLSVRNTSDSTITVVGVRMANNDVVSASLSQFPITIAPFNTAFVTLTGYSSRPGVYRDTVSVEEICGTVNVPVQLTVNETPWFTRCDVRITSSGEVEELLAKATTIVDVLGRSAQLPLSSGIYLVIANKIRYVVQMP